MSVAKRDYYEVLSVSRDCDEQTLKSSYRKLALQYHPDRNPGNREAEEKFKEAAEAYSILSDPQKRAAYDRYGHQAVNGAAGGGFDESQFADFGDILGDLFGFGDIFGGGGRSRRTRQQRGEDLRYDLEISFEDVMRGMSADLQIPRMEPCSKCAGTGAEPNGGLVSCAACSGRGEILYQQGFLSIRKTCPTCSGRGKVIRQACSQCRGQGFSRVEKKLKVNIPPGVDNGTRLRLSGEGNPGPPGSQPGDLYVVIKVADHLVFERRESDLHCTLPINIAQAALGAEIEVQTFDGPQTIKIPEGTQSGAHFKLRNLGVPHVNSRARGDLYVHADVQVPKKLTREQRKLFEELRDVLPAENIPHEKSVFEKVRDFFG
ncbi:MAG: molecular chaperone DnaJ [Acidobacteriaceae bacterium]|nr:molecular chaperone DnaJ [Acidobacteriaceae bacterium]MBV9226099.1 molecular chaperone DnaJ [Acidobacteriaceae bacterium]MBV9307013.1 molecular chaperone DnaJ [Acidobacteriaceae bacterium]MBV9679788.1 molecular chaperone DnaJ [Acidobacteriaceae bacterium]MBV9940086.1 molecular chaperone DnaJ [Acidobacteriaceae bacterium]